MLPYWRDWRLRDIGRQDVQQWVAEKFRQRPARGVKFPPKDLKDAPAIIAGADFARLLAHLKEPCRTMMSLIAATGLRIGELLALRWRVLELEHGTLAVRESLYEGKFNLLTRFACWSALFPSFTPPRTPARRTSPLSPTT